VWFTSVLTWLAPGLFTKAESELPMMHTARRELLAEPTNEALRRDYKELKAAVKARQERAAALGGAGGAAVISAGDVRLAAMHGDCLRRWQEHRAIALAVLDQICVRYDGLTAGDLVDEMGLDTDEANGAELPRPLKRAKAA
jgi:hypothetical protein